MTLISIRELENSTKINQLFNGMNPANLQNNLNFMLQNASVTKANIFTNAMFQQLQFQQQNQHQQQASNMYNNNNNNNNNKNMTLNSLSSNSISNSSSNQQQQQLHSQANCNNSENGSSKGQNQVNSSRYKTELCRQFIENGGCKYGEKCQFAHGVGDLKDVNRHPKYKTDYCKTFHSKGFCPYGPRCHFIHELNEKCDNLLTSLSSKKNKSPQRPVEESKLDKQLEALHTRLSTNLLLTDDYQKTSQQQIEDLNSSFLSTSSPPLSPMPQSRARIGSGSSLVSSASSYDMSQSDRAFSPIKQSNSQQSFLQQQPQPQRTVYNIPLSKNLIQIGQSLINEKLNNSSQDQTTLAQQIASIERLNSLLNSNQLNFYHNDAQIGNNFNW